MSLSLRKKTKRGLERAAKKLISKLPKTLKGALIRNLIKIDRRSRDVVEVKVAETIEEFEQIFILLRKNYITQGFIKESDPLSINKYQAAHNSSVLVAKVGEKVVGTLTLVNKIGIGLPLERVFDISADISRHETVYEITCLAIDMEYRRKDGFDCLFPLMKYMYLFTQNYLKVDKLFIACLPRDTDFYTQILFFQNASVNSYVEDYLGAPAQCMFLNFKGAEVVFKRAYNHKSIKKNLYSYFVLEKGDHFDWTVRSEFTQYHYEYFKNRGYELKTANPIEAHYFKEQFSSKKAA